VTPDQAAWVRANVWTGHYRAALACSPDYMTRCACERQGISSECRQGSCRCNGLALKPAWETVIGLPGGRIAGFPATYQSKAVTAAFVWLADRTCRTPCSHGCHTAPDPPPAGPVQLGLFAEVA
jgi:hypothetical protein